jgi:hypothetical protein
VWGLIDFQTQGVFTRGEQKLQAIMWLLKSWSLETSLRTVTPPVRFPRREPIAENSRETRHLDRAPVEGIDRIIDTVAEAQD